VIVFENYPVDATLREDGRSLGVADQASTEQTHYPLTIVVVPGSELRIAFWYSDAVNDAAVRGLLDRFEAILNELAARPLDDVASIEIVREQERTQLVDQFNAPFAVS
jgi:Condensation domain